MTMIKDCTGLVLAGGHSRRMGRDKTVLEFNGQTLLQRTVALLQTLFPSVLVSVRGIREDVAVPQVVDELPDAGPLAGLAARAVVVIDENDQVVYSQLVNEITEEPDYDAALAALKA